MLGVRNAHVVNLVSECKAVRFLVRRFISLLVLLFVSAVPVIAARAEEKEQMVNFEDHIKPIFREHCTACHSESDKESDLALDTYGATLAGGSSGEVIVEGNAGASRLFALVSHAERPYMPPDEDAIDKAKIELLKTWIEQGMPENSGSKIKRSTAAAAAMLSDVGTGKPDGPPPLPESALSQPVLVTERSAAISALAASPWAPLIAVGGQQQVVLYHAQTSDLLAVIPFPEGEPQSLTFTRDGKQLLIGGGKHSHSGCAVLVDVATGERITKVGDELDIVLAADISPDKSRIAIAGPQKIIRIFDSLSGEKVLDLKKHTDWIYCLRYSPDGILLASGDRSNGLILWEADSGNLYAQYNGHKGAVRSLDFRPDSNVLVSASLDGTIKLWDLFENKEIRSWNAHGGGVTSVAFSNQGLVGSAGRDSRVKLWKGDGSLQQEFKGLSEAALEVAVVGDAAQIAGGDWNGNVKLWNVADSKQVSNLAANPASLEERYSVAKDAFASAENAKKLVDKKLSEAQSLVARSNADRQTAESVQLSNQKKLKQLNETNAGLLSKQRDNQEEIERLRALLAAAEKKGVELVGLLKTNEQEIASETESVSKATAAVKASVQATELATTSLLKVKTEQSGVTKEFELAESRLKAIEAAKTRFEQRAKELQELVVAHASKLTELQQQLEKTESEGTSGKGELSEANQQVADLTAAMNELQAKLSRAKASKQAAEARLSSVEKKTQELKQNIESESAAKVVADEKLKLYEESYKKD